MQQNYTSKYDLFAPKECFDLLCLFFGMCPADMGKLGIVYLWLEVLIYAYLCLSWAIYVHISRHLLSPSSPPITSFISLLLQEILSTGHISASAVRLAIEIGEIFLPNYS